MWSLLIVLHWIVAGTQAVFAGHNHGLDYVLLGILFMVGMETALEELGFWVAMYVRSQII